MNDKGRSTFDKVYEIVHLEDEVYQVLSCRGTQFYWEDAWREFQGHLNECEAFVKLKEEELL